MSGCAICGITSSDRSGSWRIAVDGLRPLIVAEQWAQLDADCRAVEDLLDATLT